jgi:hypothetical protein
LEASCQRCHEPVRETDRYCPACGLPQLTYASEEVQVAGSATPPPFYPGGALPPEGIAWRPALKFALLLAIPSGVLCAAMGATLGLVWMAGAAACAVSLYTRRTQTGAVSSSAGARIGLITGLFTAWLAVGADGVALWFGRFVLHQGNQMDSLWNEQVANSLQLSQQMITQMGMNSAQAAASTQLSRAMMLSAEGRAAIALFSFAMGGAFLVLVGMAGGALGARYLTQPRRT